MRYVHSCLSIVDQNLISPGLQPGRMIQTDNIAGKYPSGFKSI